MNIFKLAEDRGLDLLVRNDKEGEVFLHLMDRKEPMPAASLMKVFGEYDHAEDMLLRYLEGVQK